MEFIKTQKGRILEQAKQAIIAHIPVLYIPTDQMEIVYELLYGESSINSLVPRIRYSIVDAESRVLGYNEFMDIDERTGELKSINDNYKFGSSSIDFKKIQRPHLFVAYVDSWTSIVSDVKAFIKDYLGIKDSGNYPNPVHTDAVHRSLCIVVTPQEEKIPSVIAPYTKTIKVPNLSDEEIEYLIKERLESANIAPQIIGSQLMSQMIVSFRGFGKNKIVQILDLVIANQSLDFDYADTQEIMAIIRSEKKQMLNNSLGLKWEKSHLSGVAGLDSITSWITDRIDIFKDPELARCQHMDIPNGVLISGIPGSGKSLMAKTAASILDMPLVSLDMGALLGGLMGESEHNMINALAMAEQMAPCVLWIDEIEKAFSGSSQNASASDGGVGRRMFGKFLTWLQEKTAACFVFATSNDITSLPPELFRSERFDRKFYTFMPTASECASIFAANISAQNRAYQRELESMPVRVRVLQAQQLFSPALENPSFWLDVINECCTSDISACELKKVDTEDNTTLYTWSSPSRPKNKLMTGADISSLLREAKFIIHPKPIMSNIPSVIYDEPQMRNAVRTIMKSNDFKPYGETNLKDIVKCFIKLHENEFIPAGGKCILDFDCFDKDRKIYIHEPRTAEVWTNTYDKVLYNTLVGAINYYSKELKDY